MKLRTQFWGKLVVLNKMFNLVSETDRMKSGLGNASVNSLDLSPKLRFVSSLAMVIRTLHFHV